MPGDGMKATYLGCGFDEAWMQKRGLEHRVCDGFLELEPGCYLVGNFERTHDFEKIPDRFVLRRGGQWERILFPMKSAWCWTGRRDRQSLLAAAIRES